MQAIEFGAGPARERAVLAAASLLPASVSEKCDWTLVERDRAVLGLGCGWATRFSPIDYKRPAAAAGRSSDFGLGGATS